MNTQQATKARIEDRDAVRYRKLRAWIKHNYPEVVGDSPVAQVDEEFLIGPTFDAAVDALPTPQEEPYNTGLEIAKELGTVHIEPEQP